MKNTSGLFYGVPRRRAGDASPSTVHFDHHGRLVHRAPALPGTAQHGAAPSDPFHQLPPPGVSQSPAGQTTDDTPAPPEVIREFPATGQVRSIEHQHFRRVMRETNAQPRHSLRVARHAFAHRR